MFTRTLITAAVAAALPAMASAITFDFAGATKSWGQGALSFTDAGTGITATLFAGTHTGSNAPFGTQTPCGTCVQQHGNGVSVLMKNDDTHEIDDNEYLTIQFSEKVGLGKAWFNYADYHDQWDMAVDNVDVDVAGLFGDDYINGSYGDGLGLPIDDLLSSKLTDFGADFIANGGPLLGQTFTFYTNDNDDDYKLAGLEFSQVAAVPLPAGALLLLTGLGAFGVARRVRSKG